MKAIVSQARRIAAISIVKTLSKKPIWDTKPFCTIHATSHQSVKMRHAIFCSASTLELNQFRNRVQDTMNSCPSTHLDPAVEADHETALGVCRE